MLVVVPLLVPLAPGLARAEETPPAPAVAKDGPPAPSPATTVELSADDSRATIERRVGTMSPGGVPLLETGLFTVGQWEHACLAPCTITLDPRYAYRVAGDGLVPTDSFGLPHTADRVRVEAKMGASAGRTAGVLTTGLGVAALAAGGLALLATPILHSEEVGSEGFRTAVLAGGLGGVTVGVVAIGIGAFLWLTHGSTAHTRIASLH